MVKQVHVEIHQLEKSGCRNREKHVENGFFPGQGILLLLDQEKLEKLKILMAMVDLSSKNTLFVLKGKVCTHKKIVHPLEQILSSKSSPKFSSDTFNTVKNKD